MQCQVPHRHIYYALPPDSRSIIGGTTRECLKNRPLQFPRFNYGSRRNSPASTPRFGNAEGKVKQCGGSGTKSTIRYSYHCKMTICRLPLGVYPGCKRTDKFVDIWLSSLSTFESTPATAQELWVYVARVVHTTPWFPFFLPRQQNYHILEY